MDRDFPTLNNIVSSIDRNRYSLVVQTGFAKPLLLPDDQGFDFCDDKNFAEEIAAADIILCHAGVGVITAALNVGKKPMIVVRNSHLNEHTNDHQRDFVNHFAEDNLFYEVGSYKDIEYLVQEGLYTLLPSRPFITNLSDLKKDLIKYLDSILT